MQDGHWQIVCNPHAGR